MYAYFRFWNAKKAMLLYPREPNDNGFKKFLTEDCVEEVDEINLIKHECKMGFIFVLKGMELVEGIGMKVLPVLGL
tara:strand:- start:1546 stop:1773 length:228 start_codon:yes stop_codon:yes gene_type:complete